MWRSASLGVEAGTDSVPCVAVVHSTWQTSLRAWQARASPHACSAERGSEGLALPARQSAKYKTFVQGLALVMAVMPTLEESDTLIGAMLWVAVAWTVFSGVQYLLDGQNALSETGD